MNMTVLGVVGIICLTWIITIGIIVGNRNE